MFTGKRPNELFGKFTWRIENFYPSEIGNLGKRELRSTQFDVGEYKWYVDQSKNIACAAWRAVCSHAPLWGCCCCAGVQVHPGLSPGL
jgi:hypothetical protein